MSKCNVNKFYYKNNNLLQEDYVINNCWYRDNNLPTHILYSESGIIVSERYYVGQYTLNSKLHRIGGPALIDYYNNGKIKYSINIINNTVCNDYEGFAVYLYNDTGTLKAKCPAINGFLDIKNIEGNCRVLYTDSNVTLL